VPTSNPTYVRNQFSSLSSPHPFFGAGVSARFPHIRKTLGVCYENGSPPARVRYGLVTPILNGCWNQPSMTIPAARGDAMGRFIRFVREPRSKGGRASGSFSPVRVELGRSGEYIKRPHPVSAASSPARQNRTYIPNQFLILLSRSKPLGVVKIVGAVVPLSIGLCQQIRQRACWRRCLSRHPSIPKTLTARRLAASPPLRMATLTTTLSFVVSRIF